MSYQIGEVARLAGVSVRTLHYYDELGLLVPSERSPAGYRIYTAGDLLRLQQIAIQRELGLPLEEIRRVLDDPDYDHRGALVKQRAELLQRADQARAMVRAIDRAIAILDQELPMSDATQELFFEEARERWGQTDLWKISAERTKRCTDADWRAQREEQAAIYADLARTQAAGATPTADDVQAIVERHRLAIDRWFYPCSREMHGKLADLYENDARFAENIDKHGAGLTPFLVAAIRASR